VPDPNKGGQYVATLQYPRKIAKDVAHKFMKVKEAQAYINEHKRSYAPFLRKKRLSQHIELEDTMKNKIYWKILLGIIILTFIIYRRLFYISLPREINNYLPSIRIVIYSAIFFGMVIALLISCY
jgi:hypothetical protein